MTAAAEWLGVDPAELASLGAPVLRRLLRRRHELVVAEETLVVQGELSQAAAQQFARLRDQAILDPLTGVLNRRGIEEQLRVEMGHEGRTGAPLGTIMLDVVALKRVNDELGHAAGDALLQEVAHLVRSQLRVRDHVGRIGGDEFLVLLPSTDLAGAEMIAERIASAAADLCVPSARGWEVALSVGSASTEEAIEDPKALVALADERMYASRGLRRQTA